LQARPNFLGIGVIKSGTTWLADVLASHPQVFIAHGKELHYFSENHDRGEEWYLRHFDAARREIAIGEFSVSYLDGEERTAQRIYDFDPGLKLIVALRHPVERAFSQYCWLRQFGVEFDSFEAALEARPDLIANGLYFRSMQAYWQRFPEEQIHFILQDDIREHPRDTQHRLFEFLAVDPDFQSPLSEKVVGQTIAPRSKALEGARQGIHGFLKKNHLASLITGVKKIGVSRLYRQINDARAERPVLSPGQKHALMYYFANDLKNFQMRSGVAVSHWLENE